MSLATWAHFLAWLAAETTILVAGAAMLHLWLRSPRARRTIWRTALTTVALVWIVELSGLRERRLGPVLPPHRFVITASVLPPSQSETLSPEWQRRPAAEPKNTLETTLPLWIWLGGSLLLLARCCLARVWLAQRRRAAAPADPDSLGLIARWQTAFGLRRVQAQVWDGLRGPVAFGMVRPTIALPPDFTARFSSAEREAMLAHEMAHLAAHDPFWWMVSDVVIALAWWHPLVWWARNQLQSAHEAAADEAGALIPGGARTLAECLVRLGRELTASGPARALGVGGNGVRSQLAARVERLLREPRAWRPMSVWARWTPQVSALLVALASAVLPIQTGISGSILGVLATAAPARAEALPILPASAAITNQVSAVATPAPTLALATNQLPSPISTAKEQPAPKRVTVASLALASRPSPQFPSVPISRDKGTNGRPKVLLLTQIVTLTEPGSTELGLDWVFGLTPTNNPAVDISHDWIAGLQPFDIPKGATNDQRTAWRINSAAHTDKLMIDHLRTIGQSAILRPAQFAALRERILLRPEGLLSAPKCLTFSGLEARLSIQELTTVVTDVHPTLEPASVNYSTEGIGVGPTVDIVPTLEDNGQWRLRVRASVTAFLGYDNYGKNRASFSVPGGKPMGYEIPHPHFRAMEAEAEDTLRLGQTLALRGPLWTETTKIKGHFLVPAKTKTVRQRLYIFVTPTLPSPSESKKS